MEEKTEHPVILFDGECNLCNGAVQLVIRNDKKDLFRFASLQSEFAKNALANFEIDSSDMKTFILSQDGKMFSRSTAALRVAKKLSGVWPLLYGFMIVPKFIRDGVYNFISRNRYTWFGKRDSCWMPTPDLRKKFLS
jgi:predicted DCC family thiol-disulfide oxidoreductase YuxK